MVQNEAQGEDEQEKWKNNAGKKSWKRVIGPRNKKLTEEQIIEKKRGEPMDIDQERDIESKKARNEVTNTHDRSAEAGEQPRREQ